jgi:hypothetical protein
VCTLYTAYVGVGDRQILVKLNAQDTALPMGLGTVIVSTILVDRCVCVNTVSICWEWRDPWFVSFSLGG